MPSVVTAALPRFQSQFLEIAPTPGWNGDGRARAERQGWLTASWRVHWSCDAYQMGQSMKSASMTMKSAETIATIRLRSLLPCPDRFIPGAWLTRQA